jgi:hypothetical protein
MLASSGLAWKRDCTFRVDDTVPWDVCSGWEMMQRIPNEALLSGQFAHPGNLTVGRDTSSWDFADRSPDADVRVVAES